MELMVGGRSAWMQVERGPARRTRHLLPAAAPTPAASCRSGSAKVSSLAGEFVLLPLSSYI